MLSSPLPHPRPPVSQTPRPSELEGVICIELVFFSGGRYSLYKVSTRASDDVIQPMMKVRGKKGIRPSDIQLTRSLLVVTSVIIEQNSV